MERLPFIDAHVRQIDASPEQVWPALVATVGHLLSELPGWLAAAWGLQHPTRTGAWDPTVAIGDTVPGFAVAETDPPRLLTLRGRHRFSEYELRFELDRRPDQRTCLRATSSAIFPGVKGRAYRTLVIGTRGHRVAVRRILGSVARKAERPDRCD
jgi:hypothetical protein